MKILSRLNEFGNEFVTNSENYIRCKIHFKYQCLYVVRACTQPSLLLLCIVHYVRTVLVCRQYATLYTTLYTT